MRVQAQLLGVGYHPGFSLAGLGDPPSDFSLTSGQIGAGLLNIAPATGPVAAPFVAAAGGIAQIVSAVARLFSGCGQTCVLATSIVNQVEPYLLQNLNNYLQNPNRTTCDQQAAAATFQQVWNIVQQKCGDPSLAAAGQRCIGDRGPSGCTWKNNGACWNWFVGYYDPIINDTPPGGSACVAASSGSSSSLSSYLPWLLLIGLGVLVVAL